MVTLFQFLFILFIPLATVAGVLIGLFAVGALFDALENPDDLRLRLDGLFKQPPATPRETAPHHYYRPHWR